MFIQDNNVQENKEPFLIQLQKVSKLMLSKKVSKVVDLLVIVYYY